MSTTTGKQADMMRTQGFYPVKEMAEQTGLSVWTIYRYLRLGKVKGTVAGRTRYVHRDSLALYLGPEACDAADLDYPGEEAAG